LGERW